MVGSVAKQKSAQGRYIRPFVGFHGELNPSWAKCFEFTCSISDLATNYMVVFMSIR